MDTYCFISTRDQECHTSPQGTREIRILCSILTSTQSHEIWDIYREWELEQLENASAEAKCVVSFSSDIMLNTNRPALVEQITALLLERLKQPHSSTSCGAQSYFTLLTTAQTRTRPSKHTPPSLPTISHPRSTNNFSLTRPKFAHKQSSLFPVATEWRTALYVSFSHLTFCALI